MPHYWLLKTEPTTFSFDDLWSAPKRTTFWDGVRNFQARNTLRDKMKKGDQFFVAATDEEARRTQQTLSTAACQYGKNHGMEFTTRRVEGGVRTKITADLWQRQTLQQRGKR